MITTIVWQSSIHHMLSVCCSCEHAQQITWWCVIVMQHLSLSLWTVYINAWWHNHISEKENTSLKATHTGVPMRWITEQSVVATHLYSSLCKTSVLLTMCRRVVCVCYINYLWENVTRDVSSYAENIGRTLCNDFLHYCNDRTHVSHICIWRGENYYVLSEKTRWDKPYVQ